MTAQSRALTPKAVRSAIRAAFPALRVGSCTPLGEGWDSAAWLIDETLVFRFPKREAVARTLETEIALLPDLAAALPVPIPRFDYVARHGAPTDEVFPFVGYTALRGIFLDQVAGLLTPDSTLIADLAAALRALHRFPREHAVAAGVADRDCAGWVAHWERFVARTMHDRERRLTPTAHAWAAALGDRLLAELRRVERPVALIHHDLALEHLLASADGKRLAGIIDWGDLALGDPALDFVGVALGCPAAALDALLDAYGPVDDRIGERIALYGQLIPFHQLYFGLELGDGAVIAEAVAAIEDMSGR